MVGGTVSWSIALWTTGKSRATQIRRRRRDVTWRRFFRGERRFRRGASESLEALANQAGGVRHFEPLLCVLCATRGPTPGVTLELGYPSRLGSCVLLEMIDCFYLRKLLSRYRFRFTKDQGLIIALETHFGIEGHIEGMIQVGTNSHQAVLAQKDHF